jgi:pimeloyl-ACP methyl ester carboxylesterase
VYVPELPGYGHSGRVKPLLSVAQFADALMSWLDAMDLPRVTLLGNSFGCQIAAEAAMRFPECFDRLILTGPTVDPDHRSVFDLAWRLTADVPRERLSIVPW